MSNAIVEKFKEDFNRWIKSEFQKADKFADALRKSNPEQSQYHAGRAHAFNAIYDWVQRFWG